MMYLVNGFPSFSNEPKDIIASPGGRCIRVGSSGVELLMSSYIGWIEANGSAGKRFKAVCLLDPTQAMQNRDA
jgi:hypothetical protein